jgi:hypothetical protein
MVQKVPKLRFSSLVAIRSALCFEFVNDSVFHFKYNLESIP